jgi:uncharacterized protein (DUF2237 family)
MRKNVFGQPLKICKSNNKITGWKRDGYCSNDLEDVGTHIVCARVTTDFLMFSYSKGNDLITTRRGFVGLLDGDRWCLCVMRWIEAYNSGAAPPIFLESTDQAVLKYVNSDILRQYALD